MERTQEEVIKIFEEKQQSAEQSVNALKGVKSKEREQRQLIGEVCAYEDCIATLRGCTIVEEQHPKAIQERALVEPLCNKCIKTSKACPFHRMGSAYEDCSGFEEQPNQDLSKMYGKLPISEEIANKQFENCDQPFETIKVRVSGKVVEYGENNIRIMDGVNVYQFPKYAVDRHQELCETASEDVGADMPKLKENTPKGNRDKYVEELLNDNTKLRQELAQCKDTIVELANEVTTYRIVARDRG